MGLDCLDQDQDRVISSARPGPSSFIPAFGAWLIVFAARSREILLHAGSVPYYDQWKVEGWEIIRPWLQGTLSLRAFFVPHHEHIPAWTRLLAWLEIVVFDRWDPLLQCMVNAAVQASVVAILVSFFFRSFSGAFALPLAAFTAILSVLPHAWENITWGFQSQFPFALLFLTSYVIGTFTARANSLRWWVGQASGLAGLFTLGSMIAAPISVVLVVLITNSIQWKRSRWITTAVHILFALVLVLWARSNMPSTGVGELHARDPQSFLHALFRQWSWPVGTVTVQFPFLLLLMRRFRDPATPTVDKILLSLGLWCTAQVLAIAWARSGEYSGYVSRYSDVLQIGAITNLACLFRLLHESRLLLRWGIVIGGLGWLAAMAFGLHTINTTGHTAYFHQHSATINQARYDLLLAESSPLPTQPKLDSEISRLLYPAPEVIRTLLTEPGFKNLLIDFDGLSTASRIGRGILEFWLGLIIAGVCFFITGSIKQLRQRQPNDTYKPIGAGQCIPPVVPAGCTVICICGVLLWPMPWVFGTVTRKTAILELPDTIPSLSFHYTSPTEHPVSRIEGGAQIEPGDIRNRFFGTHVDSARDRLAIESSAFSIAAPRLTVPFAGNAQRHGVTLALKILSDKSNPGAQIICQVPSKADVMFWEIDTSTFMGRKAQFILKDDSAASDGWIAISHPQFAIVHGMGEYRTELWHFEESAFTRIDLIMLISLFTTWAALSRRWRNGKCLPKQSLRQI